MKGELELLKEVKTNTLEKIVEKFGKGFGELSKMQLSIWDAREIIYEEINKIANRIIDSDSRQLKGEFA